MTITKFQEENMRQIAERIKGQEQVGSFYGKKITEEMNEDDLSLFLAHQTLVYQRKTEQHVKIIMIIIIAGVILSIISGIYSLFLI